MMQVVANAVMTKGRVSLQLDYTESMRRIAKATLRNFITECYSDAYGSDHAVNNQLADERDTVLRITGKNRKIAEHPLTTLAVTVGLNAPAHASTEENSKVRVVTQSLQDAALLEAVNSVGELKNVINSFLEPERAAESER